MRRYTGFGWLELVVGVLLIILGIATLIKPGSVLTGVIVVYGIIALLTGIDDIIFYAKMEQHMGFGPTISLISGILSVLAGMILLVHPAAGKWALALLLPMWSCTLHCKTVPLKYYPFYSWKRHVLFFTGHEHPRTASWLSDAGTPGGDLVFFWMDHWNLSDCSGSRQCGAWLQQTWIELVKIPALSTVLLRGLFV